MKERLILSGLLVLFCTFLIFPRSHGLPDAVEIGSADAPDAVLSDEPAGALPSVTSAPAEVSASAPGEKVPGLVRLEDIVFRPASRHEAGETKSNINMDFTYLMQNIFLAQDEPELRTGVLASDIDANKFLNADMTLNSESAGPKVLIFHTHSGEMYADSLPGDIMEGVAGAGRHLASLLNDKYGIETLHHTARYDIVDGSSQISGAYERMEPDIRRVLADNPSIEMVIDLHRDGVPLTVAVANGKRAAKIMFVNGMCAENVNGTVVPVPWLDNPYIFENLALSFRAQLAANELYPGFARRIFLKPYRYSLHMLPKSMIVEVGSHNNTKREALNAAEGLAEIIAKVVTAK